MNVGETYREDGRTMLWVTCPECSLERGIKKKYTSESSFRLCKECNLKQAKIHMRSLWTRSL